jgi:hypothetical protein
MPPGDAERLRAVLDRAQFRRWLASWLWGIAALTAIAGVLLPFLLPGTSLSAHLIRIAIALAPVTAWTALRTWPRWERSPARAIESEAVGCANLLVTAEELLRHPARAHPEIRERVVAQAAERASTLDLTRLFPLRAPFAVAVATLLAATTVTLLTDPDVRMGARSATAVAGGVPADGLRVSITVVPPAYLGARDSTLQDPARVDVTTGSRLRLRIDAPADSVLLETLDGRRPLAAAGDGTFTGELPATADGFLSITAHRRADSSVTRRLVGLSVRDDPAPRVRIVAPGRDLFIPDGNRTLPVTIEAEDDRALTSLRLRWTRVTGSGERFTFTEGEVPVTVTQRDGRSWTARAQWDLAPLSLEPGDVLVYRALAADARPGAPPSESDAYLAEVLMAGGEAASGFALDPDEERYALSQQMVILKTERLEARRGELSSEAFAEEAAAIAGEQRRVRAEFVFMMGGEFAELVTDETEMGELDESHEAEAEDDLSAGRMVNRGRTALLAAVRAMSRAAVRLVEADTRAALPLEREALKRLEEAFARSRFLMRALSQRERLDESRRLTGTMDGVGRAVGPEVAATPVPRVVALRRVLADVAAIAATRPAPSDAAAITAATAAVLRVDPSGEAARTAAGHLDAAAAAARDGVPDRSREALAEAVRVLGAELAGGLRAAPAPRPLERRRLDGALADRRAGR